MIKEKIYKGSSKTLYPSNEENAILMSFDDTLRTSDNNLVEFSGKGVINNSISALLMEKLDLIGIETHLIQKNNMRQQLIQFVDIIPIQVHISTIASGRYVHDFGMEEGFVFDSPIIDFRVNSIGLNYPIINESQIVNFYWLNQKEMNQLKQLSLKIHAFLTGIFCGIGIRLVDIKLEFGRIFNGEDFMIMLADEISPDTCKLWDLNTNEKLSYELAESNPTSLINSYQEIAKRLNLENFL